MKSKTLDGIASGYKHSAPEIHMKILCMSESKRRYRTRKPSNGKWRGSPILTRVCTKAMVTEAPR